LTWAEHTPSGMARAESLGHVYPMVRASLEDICRLVALTELRLSGETVVELPHNICALTKLKNLWLQLDNIKTLPCQLRCHSGSCNFKSFIYLAEVWNIFQGRSHVAMLFQLLKSLKYVGSEPC